MLRAISTGKNYNHRGGARTTRGGQRPGGASDPTRSLPSGPARKKSHLGGHVAAEGDGEPVKEKRESDVYDVIVLTKGNLTQVLNDFAVALLTKQGSTRGTIGAVDATNIAQSIENKRRAGERFVVLVDLDAGGFVKVVHDMMNFIKTDYGLIIKTSNDYALSDLQAIRNHATTEVDVNTLIHMGPRRALVVIDTNGSDQFGRVRDAADLADKATYAFIDAGADQQSLLRAMHQKPPPCVVIFQCASSNLLLVQMHDEFVRNKTLVLSLLETEEHRRDGYAHNLYDATDVAVSARGASPVVTQVTHVPRMLTAGKESTVYVISESGVSDIYGPEGAALYIRRKRESSSIYGGFDIKEVNTDTAASLSSLSRLTEDYLVFADARVMTSAGISAAVSNIKGKYRILVRPDANDKPEYVAVGTTSISTGFIKQMEQLTQRAAPVRNERPTDAPERDAKPSLLLPAVGTGDGSGGKAAKGMTLVVAKELGTEATKALEQCAQNKYDSHKVITYDALNKTGFIDALRKDGTKRLAFEVGDKKDFDLVYKALVKIATSHTSDTCPLIDMLYARSSTSTNLDIHLHELVPYHRYKPIYTGLSGQIGTGVEMYNVQMRSTAHSRKKKAIVVIPDARKDDPTFANRMVGMFQDSQDKALKHTALELTLVTFTEGNVGNGKLASAVETGHSAGIVYVLVADETDASLDVLDTINNESKYELFVVRFGDPRVGRKDTMLSGWVRESAEISGSSSLTNPIPNTLLKKANRHEMLRSIGKTGRVAHVVTGSSDIYTLDKFRDSRDKDGTLRKLICRGETHAFRFYETLPNVTITDIEPTGVLVIVNESGELEASRLDNLKKSKVRVLINPKTASQVLNQISNTGYTRTDHNHQGKVAYVELVPINTAFGMMSEFV